MRTERPYANIADANIIMGMALQSELQVSSVGWV